MISLRFTDIWYAIRKELVTGVWRWSLSGFVEMIHGGISLLAKQRSFFPLNVIVIWLECRKV